MSRNDTLEAGRDRTVRLIGSWGEGQNAELAQQFVERAYRLRSGRLKLFVSYSRGDEPIARWLIGVIESMGCEAAVFQAPDGKDKLQSAHRRVIDADAIITVSSPDGPTAEHGTPWVPVEFGFAYAHGMPAIHFVSKAFKEPFRTTLLRVDSSTTEFSFHSVEGLEQQRQAVLDVLWATVRELSIAPTLRKVAGGASARSTASRSVLVPT